MKLGNSYYDIACNEFMYLCDSLNAAYTNPAAAQAQQVAEKMIKSVAERVCVGIEKLMESHNLRGLYDAVHNEDSDFTLNRDALSTLKDYYFDTRYPGDNFVNVTVDELVNALNTMQSVVLEVEKWRTSHKLPTQLPDAESIFSKGISRLKNTSTTLNLELAKDNVDSNSSLSDSVARPGEVTIDKMNV